MRPPLAGKRAAARRLTEDLRRRLGPIERLVPVRLPGAPRSGGGPPAPAPAPAPTDAEDAAARIDAARARLRASIDPPADDGV